MNVEQLSLSTYSGIIAATLAFTHILKRLLCCYDWFNKIPVFVYACIVSAILAFLANHVIYIDDKPLLSGENVWIAMWKAGLGAASASGFYTWYNNPESPETAGVKKNENQS